MKLHQSYPSKPTSKLTSSKKPTIVERQRHYIDSVSRDYENMSACNKRIMSTVCVYKREPSEAGIVRNSSFLSFDLTLPAKN